MTSTFKLTFLTESGLATSISIPYAKQTLVAGDIKQVMQDLIDLACVQTSSGFITEPEEAVRIDTTVTSLAII